MDHLKLDTDTVLMYLFSTLDLFQFQIIHIMDHLKLDTDTVVDVFIFNTVICSRFNMIHNVNDCMEQIHLKMNKSDTCLCPVSNDP